MEKIDLLKAKEKNKNYISINSYSNNQDIIYLCFMKENLDNITNDDIPKIITNKEKMLEKLNIILKKNKIKNSENKKIMYFYKTFQKSLNNFKFYDDCSYVTFMKIENLDKGTNSVEIQFQNDTIIERGNFYDEEIGIASIVSDLGIAYEKAIVVENNKGNRSFKIGKKGKKIFFIIGEFKDDEDEDKYDDEFPNYLEVNNEELEEIIEKVNLLNEKYGIYCRVPKGEVYFYLNDIGEIVKTTDKYSKKDNKRSEIGNYFTSKRRIELFKKNLKNFIEDKIIGNFNVFYFDECFRNSNRN